MSDTGRVSWGALAAAAVALAVHIGAGTTSAEDAALSMRAAVVGVSPAETLTVSVFRWSTDTERAPMLAALAAPPAPAAGPAAAPAGGRGGRGGLRGRGAGTPASPLTRLAAAVRGAPTVGYLWADGITGYSIKYAWQGPGPDGGDRIVLITDRRLGAHWPGWPQASGEIADADFTLLEMRLDAAGAGAGKASLARGVVVDGTARTLALDAYIEAPVLLEIGR